MTLILLDEVHAAYATRPARGNGGGAFVIVAPDLVAAAPD